MDTLTGPLNQDKSYIVRSHQDYSFYRTFKPELCLFDIDTRTVGNIGRLNRTIVYLGQLHQDYVYKGRLHQDYVYIGRLHQDYVYKVPLHQDTSFYKTSTPGLQFRTFTQGL